MKRMVQVMVTVLVLAGCVGSSLASEKQDEAKAFLQKATFLIEQEGNLKPLSENGTLNKEKLSIYVFDSRGTLIAHSNDQGLAGQNLAELKAAGGNYLSEISYVEPAGTITVACGPIK